MSWLFFFWRGGGVHFPLPRSSSWHYFTTGRLCCSTHSHRPYGLSRKTRISSSNQDSSSDGTHVQSVGHDWIPTGNYHLSSTATAKRQFLSTIWSIQLPLKYAVKCSLLPAVLLVEVSWPGRFSVTVIKPNSEDGHKHFRKPLADNFSTFWLLHLLQMRSRNRSHVSV